MGISIIRIEKIGLHGLMLNYVENQQHGMREGRKAKLLRRSEEVRVWGRPTTYYVNGSG